jgi:hypothetical protein
MRHPWLLLISLLAALPGAPFPVSGAEAAVAASGQSTSTSDELLMRVLLAGLVCVAAIAMVGATIVYSARRQPRDEAPPPSAMDKATAALARRSVRRSKVRLTDDPIVAAMGRGHDSDRAPRRRPRTDRSQRNDEILRSPPT